jgi:hypothetical protein
VRASLASFGCDLAARQRTSYEFAKVAHEYSRRNNNENLFIPRGTIDVHGLDLYEAIRGAVKYCVDHAAASAISEVVRLSPTLILVKCNSTH